MSNTKFAFTRASTALHPDDWPVEVASQASTKALEPAEAAAQELVDLGLIEENEAVVYAQAIDFAFADLRAQLAEQDALIQKHLSTLTSLEDAVKERDAQLEALKQERKWLPLNTLPLNVQVMLLGACGGVDTGHRYMKDAAYSLSDQLCTTNGLGEYTGWLPLGLDAATRQPTQDKGNENVR